MHAYLVNAPPENFPPGPDTLHLTPEDSLGITEVRRLETFLSRKPLQHKNNVVIVHNAEKLTLPAQHALLKTLEEPPGDSLIYLVTTEPESLLPTILSRVSSVDASIHRIFSPADIQKAGELLEKLLHERVGERLVILDEMEFTRETALEFLNLVENILHGEIAAHLHPAINYGLLSETRKYLKANVNVRLAMDNFALNLP